MKEREFEHGSPIGTSTANLEGIGKFRDICAQCGAAPPEYPEAMAQRDPLGVGYAPRTGEGRWQGDQRGRRDRLFAAGGGSTLSGSERQ